MRLINFPWGPYPRRLTHYLAEKGIGGIDLTEVEFPHVAANWPKGFLRELSPGGTLPVLQTDEGVTIGQSIAILEYLEEKYPRPNLLGSSAEARAATRELVGVLEEATTYLGMGQAGESRQCAAT